MPRTAESMRARGIWCNGVARYSDSRSDGNSACHNEVWPTRCSMSRHGSIPVRTRTHTERSPSPDIMPIIRNDMTVYVCHACTTEKKSFFSLESKKWKYAYNSESRDGKWQQIVYIQVSVSVCVCRTRVILISNHAILNCQ